METIIKREQIGNYIISIFNRENPVKFASCPFMVELKQLRPKARYLNEKILWRYVYVTIDEAENKEKAEFKRISANINHRKEELNKRRKEDAATLAADHYKIGDILVNSWGYEQTNIEFYKVVNVGRKTIDIIEIGQKAQEGSYQSHSMACNVVPIPEKILDDGDKYTLRVKSGGNLSQPNSFYYIHKWNGHPKYMSWYA